MIIGLGFKHGTRIDFFSTNFFSFGYQVHLATGLGLIIHSFTYWNRGLVLRLVLKPYPNLGLGCRLIPKPQVGYGWVPSAWNQDHLQITDLLESPHNIIRVIIPLINGRYLHNLSQGTQFLVISCLGDLFIGEVTIIVNIQHEFMLN